MTITSDERVDSKRRCDESDASGCWLTSGGVGEEEETLEGLEDFDLNLDFLAIDNLLLLSLDDVALDRHDVVGLDIVI